jgi:hypothetical protein
MEHTTMSHPTPCDTCGQPAVSEFASPQRGPACLAHAVAAYQLGALYSDAVYFLRVLDVYGADAAHPEITRVRARLAATLDAARPNHCAALVSTPEGGEA